MAQSIHFADFIDLTYNLNYNWEFDKKYYKKSRSRRPNGGVVNEWVSIIKLMKNQLINNTIESPNFTRKLDRYLENCNQEDIRILLCSLKNRSIQYLQTKKIYEWFPEFNKQENKNEN